MTLQERAMGVEYIYEEMKMEKSWAFGFCPLSSFTLNVCPGLTVSLHIVLALALHSSVFIINLQRNYWKALVCYVSHKPSQSCYGNRLDTSILFLTFWGMD